MNLAGDKHLKNQKIYFIGLKNACGLDPFGINQACGLSYKSLALGSLINYYFVTISKRYIKYFAIKKPIIAIAKKLILMN